AHLDYTTAGGIAGDYPTVKAWLAEGLPPFPQYQHVVGNRNVTLDGDTASSIAAFFNPMVMKNGETFFCGGEYRDQLVRTADGWRVKDPFQRAHRTHDGRAGG